MKALSLWQPWAQFMAIGLKQIETRRQIREPLPMRGRQGLWTLSGGEIQAINERL